MLMAIQQKNRLPFVHKLALLLYVRVSASVDARAVCVQFYVFYIHHRYTRQLYKIRLSVSYLGIR